MLRTGRKKSYRNPCVADESPPTCSVFLAEQGLELFMRMLQALEEVDNENRVQVETKILGLLVSELLVSVLCVCVCGVCVCVCVIS